MSTLALIGLLSGLITGISPRVLPPLFFAGGGKITDDPGTPPDSGGAVAVTTGKRTCAVIAGLVLSFVVVTQLGSLLIDALGLPDTILPNTGWDTVALTISFAVGVALPLLLFALAGRRVNERIGRVRRNQKTVRRVGGVVVVLLAFALFVNVTDLVQRAVPNYTQSLPEEVENNEAFQPALSGLTNKENSALSNCTTNQAAELQDCGPAPEFKNIQQWFNSPGTTVAQLKGKVTLVDFWAYACVNCRRTLPHITDWDRTYRDAGLQVIGIHTPEFTFERDATNVAEAITKEKIEYPVGLDNQTSTFTQYRNRYWPARYLVDANGTVRNIKLGEGEYDRTEGFIRTLLTEADPSVELPPSTTLADTTPDGAGMTPETRLGANDIEKALVGGTVEDDQPKAYRFPDSVPDDKLGLTGTWAVDYEKATPAEGAGMRLNYSARTLNLVLSGQGTVTVSVNGGSARTIPIPGTPNLYTLVTLADQQRQTVDLIFTGGVQAYDFAFG
ncbi:MAG: redoxin domain-containing protein [Umezawaea sp.]